MDPAAGSRAIISREKLSQRQMKGESGNTAGEEENSKDSSIDTVTESHKGYLLSLNCFK